MDGQRHSRPWQVLVVGDAAPAAALKGLVVDHGPVHLHHLATTAEALRLFASGSRPGFALALIAVGGSAHTEDGEQDAGLLLIRHIRETDVDRSMRLVVLAPGPAHERETMLAYDIDGYLYTEGLSMQQLTTLVVSNLRSYQRLAELDRERRRALELARQIERQEKERCSLLRMLHHEIRTGLNGVLGMAELLALQPLTSESQAQVGIIRTSGHQLLRVSDELLGLSAAAAGNPVHSACDPLALLNAVGSAVQGRVRFSQLPAEQPCPDISGDALALRRALVALVNHLARKSPGAPIESSLRQLDGWIRIELSANVLDDRAASDSSWTNPRDGHGLGPLLARTITERCGGRAIFGPGLIATLMLRPAQTTTTTS